MRDARKSRDELDDLKAMASSQAGRVLGALGINERPRGTTGYIAVCDPMTSDATPSLVIWTNRPGGISWKRYGGAAQGDVIDLVAYLRGWYDLPKRGSSEAIRWLRDILGVGTAPTAQLAEDARRARKRQEQSDQDAVKREADARRKAFGLWLARKDWRDSPVETYLRDARGIDLRALPRAPQILGYLPEHPHVDKAGTWTNWPCMIAGVGDGQQILAVHRTWLARDGSAKAPVEPRRKVWPAFGGLVMPLWRGDSGLSIGEAARNGLRETFAIYEGVEDGFTGAIAAPNYRTWAAISLSNIGNIRLPECCDSVLLHRQNDWVKPEAVAAFEAAKRALEAQGRPVAEIRVAARAKDVNDLLRA